MAEDVSSVDVLATLDERRFHFEEISRNRELILREREIKLQEEAQNRARWNTPTSLALMAAALGLFGNVVVAAVNNRSLREIEVTRLHSNVTLEAIKTGNREDACKNLGLFLDLGLVEDPQEKIKNCSDDKKFAFLPSAGYSELQRQMQQRMERKIRHAQSREHFDVFNNRI